MKKQPVPRLIFWELTKQCNLQCVYCRADAQNTASVELSTPEIKTIIDDIASDYQPILVLTGGEPLYRPDIFDIARYAASKGFPVALATNGTLIDENKAAEIQTAGIRRVSISIDAGDAALHDSIRGITGSFDSALHGAELLKSRGIEFQFNITITKRNVASLEETLITAQQKGAAAVHLFMLVPVGCGVRIAETDMLSKQHYEEVLEWLYHYSQKTSMEIKATCAPHYYRIIRQKAREQGATLTLESEGMRAVTRGCLAGTGVCFISHVGDVQPCGYLPVAAGNVLKTRFKDIWESSPEFSQLRKIDELKGKCGICEYRNVCAGCRARAYYATGDMMDEEPFCVYEPVLKR